MIVESTTALADQQPRSMPEPARAELGRIVAHRPGLGHEDLGRVGAGEVGRAQLHVQFGRAAREHEHLSLNRAIKGLSRDRPAVDREREPKGNAHRAGLYSARGAASRDKAFTLSKLPGR